MRQRNLLAVPAAAGNANISNARPGLQPLRRPTCAAARRTLVTLAVGMALSTGCAPLSPETSVQRPGIAQASPSPDPSPQPAPTYSGGTAMSVIARRGTLRVATRDARPRLAITDPFTGELVGYEVDLATLLARRLLGTARDDIVRVTAQDDPFKALREGRADLVIAGVDRQDVPSDLVGVGPYLEGARVLLVPVQGPVSELGDVDDRRVCVRDGDGAELTALVDATAVLAPSLLDCGAALGHGGVVAAFGDDLELFGVADAYPDEFELLSTGLVDVDYVVVIRPQARGLRAHVVEALQDVVRSQEWELTWRTHVGPQPPDPPDVR